MSSLLPFIGRPVGLSFRSLSQMSRCSLFSLSQAGVMGLIRVIACGNSTTADMTFMTVGGVATLYPEFTLYGRNVHASERMRHTTLAQGRMSNRKLKDGYSLFGE